MTNKYHANQKTGRANICRATKRGCPLGGDTPHFDSKEEAHAYIEKSEKEKNYSFNSMSKRDNNDLNELNSLEESSEYSYPEDYISNLIPEYTVMGQIDEPDYKSSFLLEKDGKNYVLGLVGGDYHSSVYTTGAYRVESEKVEQYDSEVRYIADSYNSDGEYLSDKSVIDLVEELDGVKIGEVEKWGRKDDIRLLRDGVFSPATLPSKIEYVREDGSTVYGFKMKAPGDREFTDTPPPVNIPIELEENGERQNAREMTEGYAVYDTRSNKGFVVTYQNASDGYTSNDKIKFYKDKGLKALEPVPGSWQVGSASLYLLEGSGDKIYSKHWKRV